MKLARRNLFAALAGFLGIARAQTSTNLPTVTCRDADVYPPDCKTKIVKLGWQSGKATPNQCPVCGTMADPYVRKLDDCDVWNMSGHVASTRKVPCSPASREVRCARCNNAFWVDAEK